MAQHADLDCGNFYVVEQRIQLIAQFRCRSYMYGFNALCGLHRERGDCRDPVTMMRGKSFQVRGNTRSRRRIKARDRQYDRRRGVVMIRQSDGALRAKGSEEKWAGCAKRRR